MPRMMKAMNISETTRARAAGGAVRRAAFMIGDSTPPSASPSAVRMAMKMAIVAASPEIHPRTAVIAPKISSMGRVPCRSASRPASSDPMPHAAAKARAMEPTPLRLSPNSAAMCGPRKDDALRCRPTSPHISISRAALSTQLPRVEVSCISIPWFEEFTGWSRVRPVIQTSVYRKLRQSAVTRPTVVGQVCAR